MPRYLVKFDFTIEGKIEVPASSIEDAEDYVKNQISTEDLIMYANDPEIDIESIEEMPK